MKGFNKLVSILGTAFGTVDMVFYDKISEHMLCEMTFPDYAISCEDGKIRVFDHGNIVSLTIQATPDNTTIHEIEGGEYFAVEDEGMTCEIFF